VSEGKMVTVYRFARNEMGRSISPQRMWGTLEAIQSLEGCTALLDTARTIHPKLLEDGFYFEQVPTSYRNIDTA
jgi:hypothetical protein